MAVKAGKLRHRIAIEETTETPDSSTNEPVDDWKQIKSMWASIEPAQGAEGFSADQVQGTVSHVITVRSVAGISNKMRVRFNDRIFGILAVLNVEERGAEGRLACMEQTNA